MTPGTGAGHPLLGTTWREIRIGLAVVAVVCLGLAAFWIGRAGNPFEDQYSLIFFVENAKGLQEGAAVRLSGLVVGEVAGVDLMGPAPTIRARFADRLEGMNIRVTIELDQRYRNEITDRSRVRIGTEGLSGVRYVRIEKGPVGGRPLENGERIPVRPSRDVEVLLDKSMEVLSRIRELNRDAERVGERVKSGSGSLGRFLEDPDDNPLSENMERMNELAARVMRSIDEGPGTLALERRTGAFRHNVESFKNSVEDIQRRVQRGEGSLGGFAADTALPNAMARFTAHAGELQARVERGDGSLGRFVNDPELSEQLHLLTVSIDSLVARIGRDPLGSVNVRVR
jgi:phospholipid/cholesterol/gamma-HCH transport system substrate-binding protein